MEASASATISLSDSAVITNGSGSSRAEDTYDTESVMNSRARGLIY